MTLILLSWLYEKLRVIDQLHIRCYLLQPFSEWPYHDRVAPPEHPNPIPESKGKEISWIKNKKTLLPKDNNVSYQISCSN
jgi:hypothetical protein